MIRAIACDDFGPFGRLQMTFPELAEKPTDLAEVHLLTGVNGTGKTRILSVLAALLGNCGPLLQRMPKLDSWEVQVDAFAKKGVFHFDSRDDLESFEKHPGLERSLDSGRSYRSGVEPKVLFDELRAVPAFAYGSSVYVEDHPVSGVATAPKLDRKAALTFNRFGTDSRSLVQAITTLKIHAAVEQADVAGAGRRGLANQILQKLESVISAITGRSFSFHVTIWPEAATKVKWGGENLGFASLPDGLRAILGWIVHAAVMMDLHAGGVTDPFMAPVIFLLDEIESSLHPAWQRKVLPAFQRLFPNAQIFIATHSPFVISSLNYGWIHALNATPDGRARAEDPQSASEGDSYVSVLESIMGVREWYDPETEALLQQFRDLRDRAFRGDDSAAEAARALAYQIGGRSRELDNLMGPELRQMERILAQPLRNEKAGA